VYKASAAETTMNPDYQLPTELCLKDLTLSLKQHCDTSIQLGTKWDKAAETFV